MPFILMVKRVFKHAIISLEGKLFKRGTAGKEAKDTVDEGFLLRESSTPE